MERKPYVENINDILDNEICNILNKSKDTTKNILILSGGSLKGVAQIGALHYLKKNNVLKNIKTIASTSAGSMIGLLYCAGYEPLKLFKIMKLIDIKKARKIDTNNIIGRYGLDNGERMMHVLKKLISFRGFNENVTFQEFYRKTLINFIVTGACINDKKAYYFSHTNFPNMKVLDAIRISISIPVLFTPCVFENKTFVDGGCIDNYPINLFQERLDHVIGIYVKEKRDYAEEIKYIEEYLNNTIGTMKEGVAYNSIRGYEKQTVVIDCHDHGDSQEDIINLFDEGYKSAEKRFKL